MKKRNEKNIVRNDEINANKYTLKCMNIMTVIVCVGLLLNILDIFIIEDYLMYLSTVGCILCAVISTIVFKLVGDRPCAKYLLLGIMIIFITIMGIAVTYHTIMICAMPILCAVQYEKKKVVYYTYILSVISIFVGVMGGYYLGLCDANMLALTNTVASEYIDPETGLLLFREPNPNPWGTLPLYYAFPRALVLYAFVPVTKHVTEVISKKAIREAELKKMSEIDSMTQLYNRNKYNTMLEEVYSEVDQVGIIYWDVNGLKQVNDKLGHESGDFVISEVAGAIKENLGAHARAFRIGGDEIVVIQKNADEEGLRKMIDATYESMNRKNQVSEIKISAAAGYCIGAGKDIEEVIAYADSKMYVNKQQHKAKQNNK